MKRGTIIIRKKRKRESVFENQMQSVCLALTADGVGYDLDRRIIGIDNGYLGPGD
jgi:hypothetical protein